MCKSFLLSVKLIVNDSDIDKLDAWKCYDENEKLERDIKIFEC